MASPSECKYMTHIGLTEVSLVKSLIFNRLRANALIDADGSVDEFYFHVVRVGWSEDNELTKFGVTGDDNPEVMTDMQKFRVLKECTFDFDGHLLPRIVMVHHTENREAAPRDGNVYPPLGSFSQRGLVMDLTTGEILCPGNSQIQFVERLADFEDIALDAIEDPVVQIPIEGATVNVFYEPSLDTVFLGTGRRVMTLRKVFRRGGSLWNFYGRGESGEDGGRSRIHRSVMMALYTGAVTRGDIEAAIPENPSFEEIHTAIVETFFRDTPNVVITGILSGREFVTQSRSMGVEDTSHVAFTLTGLSSRTFDPETGRTHWADTRLGAFTAILSAVSLPVSKFIVSVSPTEYYNSVASPSVLFAEDLILSQTISDNGRRNIFYYKCPASSFRHAVVCGSGEREFDAVRKYFPKHRIRRSPNALTIRERVHQVITLAVAEKDCSFPFMHDIMIGFAARQLGCVIAHEVSHRLASKIPQTEASVWMDVAYPLSYFLGEKSSRTLSCQSNERVCRALLNLYACASPVLGEPIIEAIAEYFYLRYRVASTACLPEEAFNLHVEAYKNSRKDARKDDNRVVTGDTPIEIYKVTQIRKHAEQRGDRRPMAMRYNVARSVARLRITDLFFMRPLVTF